MNSNEGLIAPVQVICLFDQRFEILILSIEK